MGYQAQPGEVSQDGVTHTESERLWSISVGSMFYGTTGVRFYSKMIV